MLQAAPLRVLLSRVLRLRCPACGRGRVFCRRFRRAERCGGCHRRFEREEGYWVGGSEVHMFASFGLSVLACLPLLLLLEPTAVVYAAVLAGHVVLSLALFRYSRALFLAVDYYLDPASPAGGGDGGDEASAPARPRAPPDASRRRAGIRLRASRRGRERAAV